MFTFTYCLSRHTRCAMRRAEGVRRRKLIEPENTIAAFSQLEGGRTSHGSEAENGNIESIRHQEFVVALSRTSLAMTKSSDLT